MSIIAVLPKSSSKHTAIERAYNIQVCTVGVERNMYVTSRKHHGVSLEQFHGQEQVENVETM